MVELPGQKESLIVPIAIAERPDAAKGWPLKPDYAVAISAEQRKALDEFMRQQEMSDAKRDPKAPLPTDPQLAKAAEILRAELEKKKVTKN